MVINNNNDGNNDGRRSLSQYRWFGGYGGYGENSNRNNNENSNHNYGRYSSNPDNPNPYNYYPKNNYGLVSSGGGGNNSSKKHFLEITMVFLLLIVVVIGVIKLSDNLLPSGLDNSSPVEEYPSMINNSPTTEGGIVNDEDNRPGGAESGGGGSLYEGQESVISFARSVKRSDKSDDEKYFEILNFIKEHQLLRDDKLLLCMTNKPPSYRAYCLGEVAKEELDPGYCELIIDDSLRDECYLGLIFEGEDQYCDLLTLDQNKKICDRLLNW